MSNRQSHPGPDNRIGDDVTQNSPIAWLTILSAEALHQEHLHVPIYTCQDFYVGRDSEQCRLCFDSIYMSRLHFRVYSIDLSDDDLAPPALIYCEDRMSANGTFVNDTLIGMYRSPKLPYLLNDGDIISIRPYWRFRFNQSLSAPKKSFTAAQVQEMTIFEDLYKVSDRVLGSGRYGTVYAASDITTKMQRACKIVTLEESIIPLTKPEYARKQLETENQIRKKLFREVEILKELSHPNILSVYKVYHSKQSMYIFSELAPGGDLLAFLAGNNGHLDDVSACVVCHQLTLAVEYLHLEGIAHRDIKPENILVMRNQLGSRVVLSDFGTATRFRTMKCSETSRMKSQVGTEDYLAPEIRQRSEHGYTEAADLWSLGIVTVCIMTGFMICPAWGQSLDQAGVAAMLTMKDQHPTQQAAWTAVSDQGQDFVEKLLVLNATQRMTASQAVRHDWFRNPKGKEAELRRLHEQTRMGWDTRLTNINLIERIPDPTSTVANRARKRLPDATVSTYFNLEKHLHVNSILSSQTQKNRQVILDSLRKSGSPFIDSMPKNCDKNSDLIQKSQKKRSLPPIDTGRQPEPQSSKQRGLGISITTNKEESAPRNSRKLKPLKGRQHVDILFPLPVPRIIPIQEVSPNDMFGHIPIEIRAAREAEAAMDEFGQVDRAGLEISRDESIDELQIPYLGSRIQPRHNHDRGGVKDSGEESSSIDILGDPVSMMPAEKLFNQAMNTSQNQRGKLHVPADEEEQLVMRDCRKTKDESVTDFDEL